MYTTRPVVTGRTGVLASGHHLATQAGMKMFALGGNAVDAGVAAGLALAVLKPQENSLGGECPILIYSPLIRQVVAISGQGVAPSAATVRWFRGHDYALIPGDGLLAATVPALFGAYAAALATFGRLALRDVLAPAIALAEGGFPMYEALHAAIDANSERFRREWPSSAAVYLPQGRVPDNGAIFTQPALATTFHRLLEAEQAHSADGREAAIQHAVELFYRGEIAEQIIDFAASTTVQDACGGNYPALLAREDFARYATRIEMPVSATYRGYRVYKCGPWTQGPVHLQQLKLLEGFALSGMPHNGAEHIHTVIECAKLAFADRDRYYGDPDFVTVPLEHLFSDAYAQAQRAGIHPAQANNRPLWEAMPVAGGDEAYKGDTTHLDAVDGEGFLISATPSGGWMPSSPVIPALGFPLGTRAQIFHLDEQHPNGLLPGKRPRTTLTPSLAFKDGLPWMAYGTPGGDMQDQWTLQFLLNVVDFGMDLQQAIDAPSFHTTHFINSFYPRATGDGTIFVEEGIALPVLRRMQEFGHRIYLLPPNVNGEVCAARINPTTGMLEAAASSKHTGQAYAGGW